MLGYLSISDAYNALFFFFGAWELHKTLTTVYSCIIFKSNLTTVMFSFLKLEENTISFVPSSYGPVTVTHWLLKESA